jgi:DNA polymerase III subunit beta
MKFILPIDAFLNASKCVEINDPRYYLEGVHVTKNTIEATNGHYLYQAKIKEFEYPDCIKEMSLDSINPESMIIKMIQPVKKPAKTQGCEFIIFDVNENKVIATTVNQFGRELAVYLGEVIEGIFPDARRVIPSGGGESTPLIGLNAGYLKKLSEVCGGRFKSVKMNTFGDNKPVMFEVIDYDKHYSATFTLMPIRL